MIRESIADDVSHIIEYRGYKYGKLYAGQNSNFNQNLTPDGGIIGRPTSQYFIGNDSNLTCYNPTFSADKDSQFLAYFNRQFNTNYTSIKKRNQDGSEIGITESQLRGLVKRMIREEYQSKLQISDMSSQLQALPDASLNSGQAIQTLMSLLGQLDPLEAKKYVKSHLLQSPNDGFRPSGKMVFRFPRPMGKDVDIPIDTQTFKQYL
jgi:hypothetical protein